MKRLRARSFKRAARNTLNYSQMRMEMNLKVTINSVVHAEQPFYDFAIGFYGIVITRCHTTIGINTRTDRHSQLTSMHTHTHTCAQLQAQLVFSSLVIRCRGVQPS